MSEDHHRVQYVDVLDAGVLNGISVRRLRGVLRDASSGGHGGTASNCSFRWWARAAAPPYCCTSA
ncbi:hypothetical protein [Kribbella capetownensis]|uniref:hypothetical protein n=1 Tax=Kribbella capetownensis TaxID=1572659 RepID=UPI001EDCEFE4|nr:hypothetical protein [Kribbella capetownensis]